MLRREQIQENGILISPDGEIYKILSYQTTPQIEILNILTQEREVLPITSQKIQGYRAITADQLIEGLELLNKKREIERMEGEIAKREKEIEEREKEQEERREEIEEIEREIRAGRVKRHGDGS